MTNIVNIYATSGNHNIVIPKCRNLVIQLFGAGGGGGSGRTVVGLSPYGSYYGILNTSCGGGGGGGGVYGRITANNTVSNPGLTLLCYIGVGGSGGVEFFEGNLSRGVDGKNGESTFIIYNNEKYEVDGGLGGQYGEYNIPVRGNGGNGGQNLSITNAITGQPINPLNASLQVSNPFRSFGGGGGICLNANKMGIENPIGGLGGKGFVNGEALFAEYNGSDGNFIGNTTNAKDKRGGYGGGKLGNLGGNATNFNGAFAHYFLNGAGSGASPGVEVAVFGADNHPSDSNQGSGAGYSQPLFVRANISRNGANGGGGGGGVGGFVIIDRDDVKSYPYFGSGGSKGGDGKIIVSYTLDK